VEALYGPGSKPRRDTLYAGVMELLVREEPLDLEAKAFYALALLGLNQGVRDTVTYLRAAHYADTVFRANRTHPGAAHYLIHSFDDPVHAARGLEAARAYSTIAPDAAHAQHMTTHIFLALGMWDDVVSQNRIAVSLTAMTPGHYSSWLVYGLIQQGRYDAAKVMIQSLQRSAADGGLMSQNSALAGMVRLVAALQVDLGPADPSAMAARVMALELGGMQLFLGDSHDAAVKVLREATAIEDAMPMEFGPPLITEPSHEVLGTMLLEMDPGAAKAEFEKALRLAPGRSRALIGLARAAVATGDKPTALRAIGQVSANWRSADPDTRNELTSLSHVVGRMP
jgi:hypothetical protein